MVVDYSQLQLPTGVASRNDIHRLQIEVEAVESFLEQAAIRQPGTSVQLPKTSRLFDEMIAINKLNMLQANDRELLSRLLKSTYEKAPVLHMSFNNDPTPLFTQRLVIWLRENIHPYLLLQIGLHPSIGAGCVVRTTNKYFDFSLRQRFSDTRELLTSQMHDTSNPVQAESSESASKLETPTE
jgi:hypothetical protein